MNSLTKSNTHLSPKGNPLRNNPAKAAKLNSDQLSKLLTEAVDRLLEEEAIADQALANADAYKEAFDDMCEQYRTLADKYENYEIDDNTIERINNASKRRDNREIRVAEHKRRINEVIQERMRRLRINR